jgi:hypothetical protein
MQQDDLYRGEKDHLRRIIASFEPRAERRFGNAEMAGELLRAAQDEARAMQ